LEIDSKENRTAEGFKVKSYLKGNCKIS